MKSVVVTGVSTGIGWGAVKALTDAGYRVFGSVRKAADGDRLRQAFGDRFVPLVFDVTDEAAVRAGAAEVRAALGGETLAGLVNNAGVAVAGPLLHLPVADFRHQLEVNLTGVVIATQAFAPLLGAEGGRSGPPGRIVMISSVGGRNASPFMAPYCASKFGLEGLSESLRRELMLYGIEVVVVAPGAVATAIWGKAEAVDVSPYAATDFAAPLDRVRRYMMEMGGKGLRPEALGAVIRTALEAPRPKLRYTVTPDPVQQLMVTLLPKRMVDRIMGRRLGLVKTGA